VCKSNRDGGYLLLAPTSGEAPRCASTSGMDSIRVWDRALHG